MTRPLFIGQLSAFVLDNILDDCVNLSHTDVRSNEGAFEKSFPSPSTIRGLKPAGWATFRKTDGSFPSHPPFLNFVFLSLGLYLEDFSLYIWRKTFLSKSRIITISNCPLLMNFFPKSFYFFWAMEKSRGIGLRPEQQHSWEGLSLACSQPGLIPQHPIGSSEPSMGDGFLSIEPEVDPGHCSVWPKHSNNRKNRHWPFS